MANSAEKHLDIHALQKAAHHGGSQIIFLDAMRASDRGASRNAMLYLIDQLARQSCRALMFIELCAIALTICSIWLAMNNSAVATGHAGRAVLWSFIIGAVFVKTWKLAFNFLKGNKGGDHPFSWRAQYTSQLFVLGTAFGCGAILLTPQNMPLLYALIIQGSILGCALIASFWHVSHRATSVTFLIPVSFLTLAASLKDLLSVQAPSAWFVGYSSVIGVVVVCSIGLIFFSKVRAAQAYILHPQLRGTEIETRSKDVKQAYNPYRLQRP